MAGHVSFFSIGVDDADKARAFYGPLFGWGFAEPMSGAGAVIETSNVPGGIHGGDPGAAPYLFFDVDDLDTATARVHELGGSVEDGAGDDDETSIERFGHFALCCDDQGSPFGLHQPPAGEPSSATVRSAVEDVSAEIVTILDDWASAIVSNDADRIAAFMADEWVLVSESGVTPRERFLSFVESGELTHSAFERIGPARVRSYGDIAVLTTRLTNTAHHAGRRIDADEWTTEVFVRRDNRWTCVLSQITSIAPS